MVRTSTIGAGEGELDGEVSAEAEGEADVAVDGVRVRVTLKVVGTTVWNWVRAPFERVDVVIVVEPVVRERDVGNVVDGWAEEAVDCWDAAAELDDVDWAATMPQRAARKRRILIGGGERKRRREPVSWNIKEVIPTQTSQVATLRLLPITVSPRFLTQTA